jgi:methionyl aminopeptidase
MIIVKSEAEIRHMREAGHVAAAVLGEVGKNIFPGVTTKVLAGIAAGKIKALGATSACLGYHGYPGVICVSRNNVVVHGIPSDDEKLVSGDIVDIDVSVRYKGFCGDVSKTYPVGKISASAARLLACSSAALDSALAACSAGKRVGDISSAMQETSEKGGYSVVRDFTAHGIGRDLHEDPQIPNYGRRGTGPRIPEGCCLALEVMVNEGCWQVDILSDGWTAITCDGKLSAHFEHTVLVTKSGNEILTI